MRERSISRDYINKFIKHEIGNHSLNHPCTGNFPWSRQKAIENYSLKKMRNELITANNEIKELLGVESEVFAYPCR